MTLEPAPQRYRSNIVGSICGGRDASYLSGNVGKCRNEDGVKVGILRHKRQITREREKIFLQKERGGIRTLCWDSRSKSQRDLRKITTIRVLFLGGCEMAVFTQLIQINYLIIWLWQQTNKTCYFSLGRDHGFVYRFFFFLQILGLILSCFKYRLRFG